MSHGPKVLQHVLSEVPPTSGKCIRKQFGVCMVVFALAYFDTVNTVVSFCSSGVFVWPCLRWANTTVAAAMRQSDSGA